MAEAAMKRCVRWAERLTKDMLDDIREDAFIALLTKNLDSANIWATRYKEKVEV